MKEGHAFLGEVVYYVHAAQATAISQFIRYKVHRPALVGHRCQNFQLALHARDALPFAVPDARAGLSTHAEQRRSIDLPSLPLHQYVQTPIPILTFYGRQFAKTLTRLLIARTISP